MRFIFSKVLVNLLLSSLFILLTVNCKESNKNSLSGVFTFVKGSITQNGVAAKLGDLVKEGDVLSSQTKSIAIVQFSSGALITLRGNSKFKVATLSQTKDGKKIVSLMQKEGSTFSKVISSENFDYSIDTPTLTAGVRGTSFEINIEKGGNTEIQLLKGKVTLTPNKNKVGAKAQELLLEDGNKIKVTTNYGISEPQKLTSENEKMLTEMNKVKFISDIDNKIERSENEGTSQILTSPLSPEAVEILSVDMEEYTMENLKKEYGKLSKIITNSGKVYVGNFLQINKKIVIRTTDGQFSVSADEIKKVSAY